MKEIERHELLTLLELWETGAIDEREVHEKAESLSDQLGEWPTYRDDDPRSISMEVLLHLDALNHQLITTDDIPAIQAFLHTEPGDELKGWRAWRKYWRQIDFESRRRALKSNPYYCA